WRLIVAHFNHQLRGRSSDADERLVKRTAKKVGLPFVAGRANVKKFAREQKLSLEMAARKLRHDFLAKEAAKRKIRRIALAHHGDDQVELFFLRLLRGAGSEGLAGMKWQSPSPANPKLQLVRPLLDQTKSALAAYAVEMRVPFREDASNAQLDMQRNRIRHELIPWLRKRHQPALERVILRQMELLGAESEFVTAAAKAWLEAKGENFDKLHISVQRRCLQLQMQQLGLAADFETIEQLRLVANQPICVASSQSDFTQHATRNTQQPIAVQRDASGIITIHQSAAPKFAQDSLKVRLQGTGGEILFENARIHWTRRKTANGTFRAPLRGVNCEIFDAAKVGKDVILRHWQPGDRFQPIGMEKDVKLQDFFTNQKVPRVKRHELLLGTTVSGEIFWAEGLRIGERFKLDKKSGHGLKWRWERLC
ncbi:MAG TPA: tRNA lysidine(34) synthetase TilS, partial [Verrucomicrobiae bacterium]|nr:tRNA lysidine(34) synthetase TilS [Verrucomicrobiae bacterium]